MKRLARFALLLAFTAALSFTAEGSEGEGLDTWKWANFLLLAAGLGFLIVKNAPAFFATRAREISKDITESEKTRADAEQRAAAVDRKLAGLAAEIEALRSESHKEAEAETQRIAAHTATEMAKIQAHAEQEIAAAAKAARMDLRRHAAQLSISLAEQKIRARMTPAAEDGLVRAFVRDLK